MASEKFIIKRITRFSDKALGDLNALLLQISSSGYQMTSSHFKKVVVEKHTHLIGLYHQGSIIGAATLIEVFQINGHRGYIEDVVVDEAYRGRGLGKKLMICLIEIAKKRKVKKIILRTEPHRVVANQLYKKLGFEKKESNVYQMVL